MHLIASAQFFPVFWPKLGSSPVFNLTFLIASPFPFDHSQIKHLFFSMDGSVGFLSHSCGSYWQRHGITEVMTSSLGLSAPAKVVSSKRASGGWGCRTFRGISFFWRNIKQGIDKILTEICSLSSCWYSYLQMLRNANEKNSGLSTSSCSHESLTLVLQI